MCGQYVSTRRPQDLAQLFHVDTWPTTEALAPSWNVAPTDDVWAVLEHPPHGDGDDAASLRELRPLRWGLVPSWAKEPNETVSPAVRRSATAADPGIGSTPS
ncbi:SOS response-associated peptidase family protein [Streptomyces sp. NBC_00557]|uniref:SOS response-associated peptidase family protein n=1 Tax=Streptomyces sp. NBC_00557 TaxID=2975776 RepID=UPI002E8051B1|nr:SOS response-associated peptidase family protein [Streptomyces sp. NBC_00557]